MGKRLGCLALALMLALTGCHSILEREKRSVEPHAEQYVEDATALRAGNYQELVNAILYLVSQAEDGGTIRLYDYQGEVSRDVPAACLEVTRDDPLGAYAVDYMTNGYSHIMTYYEVTVQIKYRRTAEQIRSVVSATGTSAIREEIKKALAGFKPDVALLIGYFAEQRPDIEALVASAYYDTPSAAFGMPKAAVNLYPESGGTRRIVEIQLTYPSPVETLQDLQERTTNAARDILARISARDEAERALELYETLIKNARYDTLGASQEKTGDTEYSGNNAYGALVQKSALPAGYALAYQLLCDEAGIECMVVRGTVHGRTHFWNIVRVGGVYYHVDASMGALQNSSWFAFRKDADFEKSYAWDRDAYPRCDGKNGA